MALFVKGENGEWKMKNGEWKMKNGEWRMENANEVSPQHTQVYVGQALYTLEQSMCWGKWKMEN